MFNLPKLIEVYLAISGVNSFRAFFCLLIFFKIIFLKKIFQKYHQSVKQFRSRSGLTDLDPKGLQTLSADDTSSNQSVFFGKVNHGCILPGLGTYQFLPILLPTREADIQRDK